MKKLAAVRENVEDWLGFKQRVAEALELAELDDESLRGELEPELVRPPLQDLVLRPQAVLADVIGRLSFGSGMPDAIYAPLERLGVEVARALRSAGLRIPEDVMLATTHDAGRAAAFDPPLTTLGWDYKEYGQRACDLLSDLGEGRRRAPCLEPVAHHITPRASTAR